MKYSADVVLFDLDGVLIDSWDIACRAFHAAYKSAGLTGAAPIDGMAARLGRPFRCVLEDLNLPASLALDFDRVSNELAAEVNLYEGVMDMLVQLRNAGFSVGIVTGKPRARAMDVIDRTRILPFISGLTTADDAVKPDPQAVRHCLQQIGSSRQVAAFIGDSAIDMQTARNAGVPSFFAAWGALHMLEPELFDLCLKHPSDLQRHISLKGEMDKASAVKTILKEKCRLP
jgi:HAD superfamily hydrolase (TIGR01549 family)